jgi:hypothetical protein
MNYCQIGAGKTAVDGAYEVRSAPMHPFIAPLTPIL